MEKIELLKIAKTIQICSTLIHAKMIPPIAITDSINQIKAIIESNPQLNHIYHMKNLLE